MASHDEMPDEELWALSRSDDPRERADAQMELASRAKARQDWTMSKNLYGSVLSLMNKGLEVEVVSVPKALAYQ